MSSPAGSIVLPPMLAVTRVGTDDVVHIGETPIAQFPAADVTTRRHVMVQLAEAGRLTGVQIAEQFGVTPVYLSLLRGRYCAHGSAALTVRRRGPKGPMKVTPQLVVRVRALRTAGHSYRAIADRLKARTGISHQTVRRMLQDPPPAQQALPVADPPPVATTGPPIEVADGETRYAGAMLLHVALTQLGLWSVFQTLGASVGRTALSVVQVVGLIAMGFALRLRSIAGFKTAMRRDFGRLLGVQAAPTVQTLRTRVHALAESVDPAELMHTLVQAWVALEPVWEGAYYIDGHFCPYSGRRPVPKAWNAKRRLVEPGQPDLYVHDASGRVLFFINRPFNDQLVKGIPQLLTEIRALAPRDQPIVLVFDRGGYSGRLFRELTREGIGFITYLKERPARRRFPAHRFVRRWWHVEDPATIPHPRRVVYRIYEKRTRIGGAGRVRTLVVADQDAQVPVLTNCPAMRAAKVVHLLKMRWRQEHSFTYLSEHYGVEQLIQHDATRHRDDRLLANPRRAQLRQQITTLQADIVGKDAHLGRAGRADVTLRPAERRRLTRELATLEGRLARLEQRLARTPAKVPAATLTGSATRATLHTDRRNVVNAIKIATYNAERLLARHFFRHYHDPRDWFTVFRAVLHLSGTVRRDGDRVRVTLRPPDLPRVRRALAAMLDDINRMDARLFGTGPTLRFELAE